MQIKQLGRAEYEPTALAMQTFTAVRTPLTADELWLCEHPPVFTQGVAGLDEHVLVGDREGQVIPVVRTNRGGQVTYHGPGQVVAYPLVDLRRLNIYVKEYVYRLEQAMLSTLESFGVTGHRLSGAPGIYVRLDDPFAHHALSGPRDPRDPFRGLGKIGALGVKVSRHCAYHGVSFNVDMDLRPYAQINPCGYAGLRSVDLSTIGLKVSWDDVAAVLAAKLQAYLS